MANKTITQLTSVSTPISADELAIYDTTNNSTGKTTINNILNTNITGLDTTATTVPGAINELNTNLDTKVHKGVALTDAAITANDNVNQWMQIWSTNDTHGNKGLIITDSGISAYDSTNSQTLWSLTVSAAEITVTRSSGATVKSVTSYRYGKIVQVYIQLTVSAAVTPGNNLFTGTLSGPLPILAVTSPAYQSSAHFESQLDTNGSLTCRVTGTNSIGAGDVRVNFVYITNN